METNFIQFLYRVSEDKDLKSQFKENPKSFLKDFQIPNIEKREIEILEDTSNQKHFVIRQPSDIEHDQLSEAGLPANYIKLMTQLSQSKEMQQKMRQTPKEVLKSFNIDIPSEVEVVVYEDTPEKTYVVIPDFSEIQEEQLSQIAGGILDPTINPLDKTTQKAAANGALVLFACTLPWVGVPLAIKFWQR